MKTTTSLLSLAAFALVAACSAKDSAKPDSAKVALAGTPSAAASASRGTFDPATHTATIYAKDFAFESPDSISAGLTNFHLVNEGPNLHHVQLLRLDSSKTFADFQAATKNPGPPPMWAVPVGGPNAPDPGKSFDAMLDLKEGNYVLLCLVDLPDSVPHFMKGMLRPIKVTAAAGTPAVAPKADINVTLADYNFMVKGGFTAGKHTVKVENSGPQAHEVEIIRLADGKTMKDFGEWMKKPQGPPPANAIGGISGVVPTVTGYFDVDLVPGNYVLICFIPDAKDHKTHADHGMVKEFAVK